MRNNKSSASEIVRYVQKEPVLTEKMIQEHSSVKTNTLITCGCYEMKQRVWTLCGIEDCPRKAIVAGASQDV